MTHSYHIVQRSARWALLLACLVLITGCEIFGSNEEDDLPELTTTGVVVANGGNFSDQNGYVTVYDPEAEQTLDLENLGAFAQSVTLRSNLAYVALNTFGTGRIDVINLESKAIQGQISNVPAPRYIAFAGETKAYVTNLSPFGANGPEPGVVSVIDLTANAVTGDPIEVGLYPEGIVVVGDKAFVANSGISGDGTTLSVIDITSDQVTGDIELGCDGPKDLFVDDEEEVVVLCQGKTVYNENWEIVEQTPGQILFVDPAAESVVTRIPLEVQLGSGNGTQGGYYSGIAEELYVISNTTGSVYRVDTDENALETVLDVPDAADLVGLTAVAYDATAERLYVGRFARGPGDSPDYTAAGAVLVLDRAGNQVGRFTVGPAPSHIELHVEER